MASRAYMAKAGSESWNTPLEVVELLHVLWDGPPDLDPCSNPQSLVDARRNVMLPEDGLSIPWTGRVFVNPPFSDLASWLAKAAEEHDCHGAEVVFLLPARTDTRYWHAYASRANAIAFWRGRMRFGGAPASAPFPTALAYWGPHPWNFHAVFRSRAMVLCP